MSSGKQEKEHLQTSAPNLGTPGLGWWESHGAGMFLFSAALTIFPLRTAPGF